MRILVVGGTRFIGPAVVRRLAGAGHEVTVFHRGRTGADLPAEVRHIHSRDGDGAAPRLRYPAAVRAMEADVVLHMVLYGERDAAAAVAAFAGRAARLVMVGSADVYRAFDIVNRRVEREPDPVPLSEESPLRDRLFPYRGTRHGEPVYDDYDKILAERAILGSDAIAGTVLRLPMVYGPGDTQHRLRAFVRRIAAERSSVVLPDAYASWRTCWGFVENVGSAVAAAVTNERARHRIYNVADEPATTTAALVRRLGALHGWRGSVVVAAPGAAVPDDLAPDNDLRQHLLLDTSRIRSELGWSEPVSVDDALRATFTWECATTLDGEPPLDAAAEDALAAAGRAV